MRRSLLLLAVLLLAPGACTWEASDPANQQRAALVAADPVFTEPIEGLKLTPATTQAGDELPIVFEPLAGEVTRRAEVLDLRGSVVVAVQAALGDGWALARVTCEPGGSTHADLHKTFDDFGVGLEVDGWVGFGPPTVELTASVPPAGSAGPLAPVTEVELASTCLGSAG